MSDTPTELPNESTITCESADDVTTYHWSQAVRHPLQWIVVLFGGILILGVVLMPVLLLMQPEEVLFPPSLLAVFAAVTLCLGSYFLYSGIVRRGHETLTLSRDFIEYDTGPSLLPLPLMLWLDPMIFSPQMFAGVSLPPTHFIRRRGIFPVTSVGPFTLERIGERQRLRFDHGANRIEIGVLLREPERKWLAAQLTEWQS